ncbi:gliding motility lipoprotein GldH [Pleomorphovibrio marinus]|uniref:gliding motility lipoprotein GldH n=1 Tax=Pleomorphovibrio marinus TaxID=2164132 RepID=UPI0013004DE1|nr:gliding motility lipoprotein GldH [Pleomorphovibrio marinus]
MSVTMACEPQRVYEFHHELQGGTWHVSDTLEFAFDDRRGFPSMALVGLKYSDEYDYHNLYLRYIFSDSLGQVQFDSLINLSLFDPKTGKPLGGGFGKSYTKFDTLQVVFDTLTVPSKASLIHYMREESLDGVTSVGLKLLKE